MRSLWWLRWTVLFLILFSIFLVVFPVPQRRHLPQGLLHLESGYAMTRRTSERYRKQYKLNLLLSLAVEKEHGRHWVFCVLWIQWQFHRPQDAVEVTIARSVSQGSVTSLECVVGCWWKQWSPNLHLNRSVWTWLFQEQWLDSLCLSAGSRGSSSLPIVQLL